MGISLQTCISRYWLHCNWLQGKGTHRGLGLIEIEINKVRDSLSTKVSLLYKSQRNFSWNRVSEKFEEKMKKFQKQKIFNFYLTPWLSIRECVTQIILWRLSVCLICQTLLWLVPSYIYVTDFPHETLTNLKSGDPWIWKQGVIWQMYIIETELHILQIFIFNKYCFFG